MPHYRLLATNGSGSSFRMQSLNYAPIGIFRCKNLYKYEAPRQPYEDQSKELGEVKLFSGHTNFKQALKGIEGFERLWLIFEFHQNKNWKPLTRTPRESEKQGVFATRAPYRPNPIGLSCVKFEKVNGLTLYVSEFDLMDRTPILDIKPYVPQADSFEVLNRSWLEKESFKEVNFSPLASEQVQWIEAHNEGQIGAFVLDQLKRDPLNSTKKRVRCVDAVKNRYVLAFRTWRVTFHYDPEKSSSQVEKITTGYSEQDFMDKADKHGNKKLHQKFMDLFYC